MKTPEEMAEEYCTNGEKYRWRLKYRYYAEGEQDPTEAHESYETYKLAITALEAFESAGHLVGYIKGSGYVCDTFDTEVNQKARRDFLAGYKAAQQWISVKDRLPEEGIEVVIGWFQQTASNKLYWTTDVAILRNKAFGGWRNYPEATHWLELPAPPKEEK